MKQLLSILVMAAFVATANAHFGKCGSGDSKDKHVCSETCKDKCKDAKKDEKKEEKKDEHKH